MKSFLLNWPNISSQHLANSNPSLFIISNSIPSSLLVSSPIVMDEYSSNINIPINNSFSKLSSVPFPLRQPSQDPSIVNSSTVLPHLLKIILHFFPEPLTPSAKLFPTNSVFQTQHIALIFIITI